MRRFVRTRLALVCAALAVVGLCSLGQVVHARDGQVAPATTPAASPATGAQAATEASPPTASGTRQADGRGGFPVSVVWTLTTGFLVMFMQAGFALLTTGFCRAKNAAHTFSMSFMVYPVGMVGYWACGFGLQMGGAGGVASLGAAPSAHELALPLAGRALGLFGTQGFFLGGGACPAGVLTLFLFQTVLMALALTIPTGALAERWKWSAFLIYAFFVSMLTYPVFANWVWGGGWLAQLGTSFGLGHGLVDFAGSSVVHMVGGVAALAGASVLGPRLGKFDRHGKPVAIPGHHIPMALLGTLVLALGWFGLTAGSGLSATEPRIGTIAANTMLSSGGGAVAAMLVMMLKFGKPDPSMMANGLLAGLVAITAPCAFVTPPVAVLIGLVSGVIVVFSVFFVEGRLKLDDPVGAISVHGTSGAWGVLALGLFADGSYGEGWNGVSGTVRGLFYGGAGQLLAQCIGALVCFAFVFATMWVFFKVVDLVHGNRVPAETELAGLDLPEMGALAYPEFAMSSSTSSTWTVEAPGGAHKTA